MRSHGRVVGGIAVLCAVSVMARAEEPAKKPWSESAEFGAVVTSGNSQGTTFSLANKFKYAWSNAELTVDAAALRVESTTRTLSSPGGSTVVVDETTQVTAETYALAAKYKRDVTERVFWYVAASWYQNFFSGIDDRYIAGGGVGYAFVGSARHTLKGEIGADATREDPLGDPPPVELETTTYGGLRAFLGYEFRISEKSKLTEELTLFENIDETDDWRANSVTALTATLTDRLALKVSYTILYDNRPAVAVVTPTALYEFESTDTIFSAALVVNF